MAQAAHYAWQDRADVVIIRSEISAVAFRTPTDETTDVLNPDFGDVGVRRRQVGGVGPPRGVVTPSP